MKRTLGIITATGHTARCDWDQRAARVDGAPRHHPSYRCNCPCHDPRQARHLESEQDHVVAAAKANPVYGESIFLDGTLPQDDSEWPP